MKKVISLLLAICMLLGAMTAFAAEDVVLQNEKAPQVVAIGEENGVAIVAAVHGANGNVTHVPDDGSLSLVDVHHRNEIEDEAVAKRLIGAYEGVMYDVHFSDVGSLLHDGILTVDIDAALAGHPDGLIAYDLIMYELFDVMLYGEKAAALTEGAYLEFTVQLEKEQPLPLMIIYTPDGVEWKILDSYTTGANNTITIRLEQPGTLALLLYGKGVEEQDENGENPAATDGTQGSTGTNTGSNAGNNDGGFGGSGSFTPSVSGKTAPTLIPVLNQDGDVYDAYIVVNNNAPDAEQPAEENAANSKIVIGIDKGGLVVTALAERDYVRDIQTHEHLEWAYDDVLAAESMEALEAGIGEKVNELLAAGSFELLCDDLIVRDLFEITVYGEYLKYFYTEGAELHITFDVDAAQDEPFVVLYSGDSVTWNVLPAENMAINADGSVALELPELGVVAFLVEKTPDLTDEDAVQSPE